MTAIALIFSFLANLLSPLGVFLCFGYYMEDLLEPYQFVISGIAAVVGLVFGFATWGETVAPRMFWIKSNVELLDNRICASLNYAWKFFFSAFFLTTLPYIIELVSNIDNFDFLFN